MITLDYNDSYRRGKLISDGEDELFFDIREYFSVEKEPDTSGREINVHLPSRDYMIQPTGFFDFGLASQIERHLIVSNIPFTKTDNYIKFSEVKYPIYSIYDDLNYKNHYYGIETLQACLEYGRGTVIWATGAGKSFLQASLVENIWRTQDKPFRCIIVVPGLNLVHQLLDNFEEYGANFTYSGWTGGVKGLPLQKTDVVISNSENFNSKFDANLKWLRDVDLVLVDECHKLKKGKVLAKNISKIKTPHKYGFTGTLPKTQPDIWKIVGTFGPVVYEKNSKELRDEGFLTNAKVKMVKMNHPSTSYRSYKSELKYLYNCERRNDKIKKICEGLKQNTLVLVNHLEHGNIMLDYLSDIQDRDVYFIFGDMPVEDRLEIIAKMEANSNIICIAMASIFSTGINIKNLHYILFIAGGKSFIRLVQGIGRGLRLHATKEILTIIDVYDNMEYSEDHALERKIIYDAEQIEWKEIELNL